MVDAFGALPGASGFSVSLSCALALLYLALTIAFSGLSSGLVRLVCANDVRSGGNAFVFAAVMTLSDWARTSCLPEQAVVSPGYVLLDTPLAGFAPVGGFFAVSFSGFAIAYLLQAALTQAEKRKMLFLASAVLLAAGGLCTRIRWVEPSSPPLSFRLVETNLNQADKLDSAQHVRIVRSLAQKIDAGSADIVATAETASALDFHKIPADLLSFLRSFSRLNGAHLLIGATRTSSTGEGYNSVFHISPNDGIGLGVIDKRLLMPIGEYIPDMLAWFLPGSFSFVRDLSPGGVDQAPFSIGDVKAGVVICREDLTGEVARSWASGANLIVNPGNLAWFSGSSVASRELQIVRMRALEVGRPFLRVANQGGAASIDASGRVEHFLPVGQEGVLAGVTIPTRGETPFVRFGNQPIVLLCLTLVGWAFVCRGNRHEAR